MAKAKIGAENQLPYWDCAVNRVDLIHQSKEHVHDKQFYQHLHDIDLFDQHLHHKHLQNSSLKSNKVIRNWRMWTWWIVSFLCGLP